MTNQQILAAVIVTYIVCYWQILKSKSVNDYDLANDLLMIGFQAIFPTAIIWLLLMLANNRF